MTSERQDPAESGDRPETSDTSEPGGETQETDTEGHSLLQLELARNLATSRAKEVADWGRSEKARRVTEEARRRRSR